MYHVNRKRSKEMDQMATGLKEGWFVIGLCGMILVGSLALTKPSSTTDTSSLTNKTSSTASCIFYNEQDVVERVPIEELMILEKTDTENTQISVINGMELTHGAKEVYDYMQNTKILTNQIGVTYQIVEQPFKDYMEHVGLIKEVSTNQNQSEYWVNCQTVKDASPKIFTKK